MALVAESWTDLCVPTRDNCQPRTMQHCQRDNFYDEQNKQATARKRKPERSPPSKKVAPCTKLQRLTQLQQPSTPLAVPVHIISIAPKQDEWNNKQECTVPVPNEFIVPLSRLCKTQMTVELRNVILERETLSKLEANYFAHPSIQISANFRAVLIDWLADVSQGLLVSRASCYTAIHYVDQYLSKLYPAAVASSPSGTPTLGCHITKSNLQLLGVSCLWIAAKLHEIYAPESEELASCTAGACTASDMAAMEQQVLLLLDFDLVIYPVPVLLNWCLQQLAQDVDSRCTQFTIKHANNKHLGNDFENKEEQLHRLFAIRAGLLDVHFYARLMHSLDQWQLDARSIQCTGLMTIASVLYCTAVVELGFPAPFALFLEQGVQAITSYSRKQCETTIEHLRPIIMESNYNIEVYHTLKCHPALRELRVPLDEVFTRQLYQKEEMRKWLFTSELPEM
jgi:hypothetical protein